jgi:hypothetical protein
MGNFSSDSHYMMTPSEWEWHHKTLLKPLQGAVAMAALLSQHNLSHGLFYHSHDL